MSKAILLNRILLVVAFIGLFVASVLSLEAAANLVVPCTSSGGCETVANHWSSKLLGIPVAYLGVLGYVALVVLAYFRSAMGLTNARPLILAGYALSLVGALFSLYLQFMSLFVIRAFCPWCFTSAISMLTSFVVHALLMQAVNRSDEPSQPSKGDLKLALGLLPLVIIGLVVVSTTSKAGSKQAIVSDADVNFVPENAHIYGRRDAPFTVVEFADILCPACQKASPRVKEYVAANPGRLRLVYRHFPLENLHPQAMTTAAISEIAADEGKFWEFVEVVMTKGGKPESPDEIFEDARIAGLDTVKARKRLSDEKDPVYDRIARDMQSVRKAKVNSTPTFFFLVNGKVVDTAGPGDIMEKLADPKNQALMGPMMGSTGVSNTPSKG